MIEIILSIIAGIAFTVSGIFQIIRMCKTQSSRDVSLLFITLMLVGVLATTTLTYLGQNSIGYILERTINSLLTMVVVGAVVYYRIKARKQSK